MTATAEASPLRKTIGVLRHFNSLDSRMQVSTILALLEVAHSERAGEPLSTSDLMQRIGLESGTASRQAYYWADGHSQMPSGGHRMISIELDPEDHRKRSLSLTAKGRNFILKLFQ